MSEIHDRLREIARMQGRPYIDGTHLEGFGANDPPPPPLPDEFPTDSFGGVEEEEGNDIASAGALPSSGGGPPVPPPSPALPTPDLLVVVAGEHRAASVEGREVALTPAEYAAIRRVALGAVIRRAREQLEEVAALLPKRKRSVVTPAAGGLAPRRRVRRKSLLRDST